MRRPKGWTRCIIWRPASGPRGASEEQIFDLGLRGTFNVLRAVRDVAPGLPAFRLRPAATPYTGKTCTPGPAICPSTKPIPGLAGSLYGAVKIGCEELCLQFMRSYGIPVTILRFGATTEPPELLDPGSRFAHWIHLQSAIRFYGRLQPPGGRASRDAAHSEGAGPWRTIAC